MRGLFVRITVSFWAAITVIALAFGAIYSSAPPSPRYQHARTLLVDSLRMRGEAAIAALDRGDVDAATTLLRRPNEPRELAATLVRDGRAVGGDIGDLGRDVARTAIAERRVVHERRDEHEMYAVPLDDHTAIVGGLARTSVLKRWTESPLFFLRLAVTIIVGGLVSLLLAMVLTRPLR